MGCNSSKVVLTSEEIVSTRRERRSIFTDKSTFSERMARDLSQESEDSKRPQSARFRFGRTNRVGVAPISKTMAGTIESGTKSKFRPNTSEESSAVHQIEDDIVIDDNVSCESLSPIQGRLDVTRLSVTASGNTIVRPKAAKGMRTRSCLHPEEEEKRVRGSVSTPETPFASPFPGFPLSRALFFEQNEKESLLDRRLRPKAAKGERKAPNLPQQFNAELAQMNLPGTPDFPAEISPKRRLEETCLTAWMQRRIQDESGGAK